LWANLHLLFWLSIIPFSTGWMGENNFSTIPTIVYGLVLLFSAIAYWILQNIIITSQGENSLLKKAIGQDVKETASPIIYLAAIIFSLYSQWISLALYVLVALIWLVPDKRIERII